MAEGNVTSVVQAASAGVKDMADGSLRITFEFEPRHAAEAFALFGPRGRSVAIAALKDGHAAVQADMGNPITGKTPIGPLCMLSVKWCKEPEFWKWLETDPENAAHSEKGAAMCVTTICGVDSRKDIDINPQAAKIFHRQIRGPYSKYLIAQANELSMFNNTIGRLSA
jgi:hypothetical protein